MIQPRILVTDLWELAPYLVLSGGAILFLLLASLGAQGEKYHRWLSILMYTLVGLSFLALLTLTPETTPFQGLLIHDAFGISFAGILLLLLFGSIPVMSVGTAAFRENPAGTYSLLLLCACGGLFMIFSNHLLLFFMGLELLSLPLYVLSGMSARAARGSEAAFKYFLLGAVASAFFIYGVALLWGSLGTVQISEMSRVLAERGTNSPSLMMVGAALVGGGLLFKIGMVPFQMWVPDVYQGAPASLVAWMSGAVKAATFAPALRLFGGGLPATTFDWPSVLTWLAIASMVWGSFAALYQTDVKRMLAYSSIAHVGYATIGLICSSHTNSDGSATLIFYVLTYALASFSAFLVLSLEEEEGRGSIEDLSGLAKRRPGLALAFSISLLSLAGLPPLAGFMGKFNMFILAARQNRFELVWVGVLTSVVSLAYYLNLIVSAYMREPSDQRSVRRRFGVGTVLGATAAITLFLGILPGRILDFLFQVGKPFVP